MNTQQKVGTAILAFLMFAATFIGGLAVGGGWVDNGDGTITEQFTASQTAWVKYAQNLAFVQEADYALFINNTYGCPTWDITPCSTTERKMLFLYQHHQNQKVSEYLSLRDQAAAKQAIIDAQGTGGLE